MIDTATHERHEAEGHEDYSDSKVIESAPACDICADWADEIKLDSSSLTYTPEPTPEDDYWAGQSDRLADFNRQ